MKGKRAKKFSETSADVSENFFCCFAARTPRRGAHLQNKRRFSARHSPAKNIDFGGVVGDGGKMFYWGVRGDGAGSVIEVFKGEAGGILM